MKYLAQTWQEYLIFVEETNFFAAKFRPQAKQSLDFNTQILFLTDVSDERLHDELFSLVFIT